MLKNHPLSVFTGISQKELSERLKKLTEKELMYFKIMLSKSGVLYITSKPGVAKSAIIKSMADKLGFLFFDIRLSMVDETDVGLYPKVGTYSVNGVEYDVLQHVVPEWAMAANEKPSIIFFEELNRAHLAVRNAALQILLERAIGFKFQFNDNVLMVASGNLGEEDGTDVNEFDSALNNRLIHVKHELTIDEWVTGFAKDNIHPTIVGFLTHNAEHYYKKSDKEGTQAYATPRSWRFLSDYITTNYPPIHKRGSFNGNDDVPLFVNKEGKLVSENDADAMSKLEHAPITQWLPDIKKVGLSFVGASITAFIRYCESSLRISIKDVINRFDEIKNDLKSFNRDKHSELIANLKDVKITDLNAKQLENVKKFLTPKPEPVKGVESDEFALSDDEIVGYLLYVLDENFMLGDDTDGERNEKIKAFIKDPRFKKFFKTIMEACAKE